MHRSWLPLTLVLLSACTAVDEAPATNAVVGVDETAVADNASNAATPVPAAVVAGDSYRCTDGRNVIVAEHGDTADLTIAGTRYTLASAMSASGARYRTDKGPTPGKSLTWWSKGNEAMLIEAPIGQDDAGAPVVNCTRRSE